MGRDRLNGRFYFLRAGRRLRRFFFGAGGVSESRFTRASKRLSLPSASRASGASSSTRASNFLSSFVTSLLDDLTLKPVRVPAIVNPQIQNIRTERSSRIPEPRDQVKHIGSLNYDACLSCFARPHTKQIRSAQIDRVMSRRNCCALNSNRDRKAADTSVFLPKVHKRAVRHNVVQREPGTVVFYLIRRDVGVKRGIV
jgi:hypothetical protein